MVRDARSGLRDDANPGVQPNTQPLLSRIYETSIAEEVARRSEIFDLYDGFI